MTLTSYTKYCLENGDKLNVFVAVERATQAQLQALTNCDAKYDTQKGYWFIEMTKDNYKAKSKALRGLQMAFFTKAE